MREIKFRVWETVYGGMLKEGEFHYDEGMFVIYGADFTGHGIPMQYTGLKDKNGVEIYEGDIVTCVNGHDGVVEWESNDCCFNVTDYYDSCNDYPTMAFMEGQPFEVIGNIHENPELLEKNHEL